jgi:hypothetical protein
MSAEASATSGGAESAHGIGLEPLSAPRVSTSTVIGIHWSAPVRG